MTFNAFRENKILGKISEFTVLNRKGFGKTAHIVSLANPLLIADAIKYKILCVGIYQQLHDRNKTNEP